jgi:glycosyltransferase involved in cell wall biosynthesis
MSLRALIVAHEHPELSPGGAGIAAYLGFAALKEVDGVEPFFLARTDEPTRKREGTPFSIPGRRADEILFFSDEVDGFLFSQLSNHILERFADLLTRIRPHVIHFHHYAEVGLEFIAIARRIDPRVRIIVTLHEYQAICLNDGQMIKNGTGALCHEASLADCSGCFKNISAERFYKRERFIKDHFSKVDLFIAPSEFLRQRYIAWGVPPWQIVVLENGIRPVQPPPPRWLAPGERRSVFAFFGQITPYTGLDRLLLAFKQLDQLPAEATRGIRLIVNGSGLEGQHPKFVAHMRSLLDDAGDRVHFAGQYSHRDLYDRMATVDWVVVPSIWWENSPLVIQESLAHRRPVICSNIGGMAEKVRRGEDGFHFPVGNVNALFLLILRLASDEGSIWDGLQRTMRVPIAIGEAVGHLLAVYRGESFGVTRPPEISMAASGPLPLVRDDAFEQLVAAQQGPPVPPAILSGFGNPTQTTSPELVGFGEPRPEPWVRRSGRSTAPSIVSPAETAQGHGSKSRR